MTIQFSQQEIEKMSNFLSKIEPGATQVPDTIQALPEWSTIFLLLRKLLAYGVHYNVQTDSEMSYKELQTKTQKSRDMLMNVQAYPEKFDHLLASYIAYHS